MWYAHWRYLERKKQKLLNISSKKINQSKGKCLYDRQVCNVSVSISFRTSILNLMIFWIKVQKSMRLLNFYVLLILGQMRRAGEHDSLSLLLSCSPLPLFMSLSSNGQINTLIRAVLYIHTFCLFFSSHFL